LARLSAIDSRATTMRLPPGLVSFHHLRPTDWKRRVLQPTAAATVTDPTAAEEIAAQLAARARHTK
jgi:hypothetical protein